MSAHHLAPVAWYGPDEEAVRAEGRKPPLLLEYMCWRCGQIYASTAVAAEAACFTPEERQRLN